MATHVSADVPDRYESFLLGEGEKKVTMEIDTRKCFRTLVILAIDTHLHALLGMPNTSIFTFNKEDHTLGNMLRTRLFQNSHVIFSGYKVSTSRS